MKMEIQRIATKVPSGSNAFVFGSILRATKPSDLDFPLIYHPKISPPKQPYFPHAPLCEALRNDYRIQVHLTPLTGLEAKHVQFLQRTNAIPLKAGLQRLERMRRNRTRGVS